MPRLIRRGRKKLGLSPGTLIHVGDQKIGEVKISLMNYDQGQLHEKELTNIEDVFHYKDRPPVSWINVDGLHDVDIIDRIGRHFGIHPLTLEDIVNTGHRPKAEDFEDYDYIVLKMLTYDEDQNHITAEQVSFILGPHYLISFQETEGDVFNFVRERIRKAKGRIRKSGCDYLAYALIDAIVDHYFLVLEKMGEKIELLEEDLLGDTQTETLQSVHHLKREMIFFRKQVWPIREILSYPDERGSISDSGNNPNFYQGPLRSYHPGYGHHRIISGCPFGPAGFVSFHRQQPHERSHESFDHHGHHIYSLDFHRGHLRDEFRIHAGVKVALGISAPLDTADYDICFYDFLV